MIRFELCQLFESRSIASEWSEMAAFGQIRKLKMQVLIRGNLPWVFELPAIAQLVERPTVEVTQLSGGPWFESGLPELFLCTRDLKADK